MSPKGYRGAVTVLTSPLREVVRKVPVEPEEQATVECKPTEGESKWRSTPPSPDEIAAIRGRSGDVQSQVMLLKKMGYPEPLMVPVDSLDRLSSLQRARGEWLANRNSQRADPDLTRGQMANWNDRDPLSEAIIAATVVPLSQVASRRARLAFAALLPWSGDAAEGEPLAVPEPMAESPARSTSALAMLKNPDFGLYRTGTIGEDALGPHILLPSLAAPMSDKGARASAQMARLLYAYCCDVLVTIGALPVEYKEVSSKMDVFDLEPIWTKKEKSANSLNSMQPDAEATERCDRLWEAAERSVSSQPPKALPRFRALMPDLESGNADSQGDAARDGQK